MSATTGLRPHVGGRLPARTVALLPPSIDTATTRGKVLRAALELFAHKGFHGASIREIGERAGVQIATMYGHFDSKDAMLEEIVVTGHEVWKADLLEAADKAGPAAADRLVALVKAQVENHIRYAMVAVVSNGELHSLTPAAAKRVMALRQEVEEHLEGVITSGAEDGSFTPLDPATTALAIGGMGLRVANWYPGRSEHSPEELADLYAGLALRLVGAGS